MSFSYKLSEQIEQMQVHCMSAREITKKLGFYTKFELAEITKVLAEMVADGKLEENRSGRFFQVKQTTVFRGKLRGNKRGFAFLIREDDGDDLFIPHKGLNTALHGDIVDVSIVKGDEGRVEKIIERGITRIVGSYQKSAGFGFVLSDDHNYYSDIFIPRGYDIGAENGTKVIVEIIKFEGKNPTGKIVEVIGKIGEKQSDVLSILKSHGFDNVFPENVEAEANAMKAKHTTNRTSYIDMMTLSIDGDDSKDLDDAISILKYDGFYKLYVHIADVSHYVEQGSILDKEAFKRATSVYFPGSVYPMLPPVLSNGLCSLNGGEDRLTLTCVITINNNGEVTDRELVKSIINNDYAMTYNNVTAIIDGDVALREKYSPVVPMIEDALALSKILNKRRNERGNINFDTKESKIILDEEGNVDCIKAYAYTVSNGMIEEFMLIANETVAEYMCEKKLPFVFRVHEVPDLEKITNFKKFIEGCGYKMPAGRISPKVLQQVLDEVKGSAMETIISKIMLRSMQKAKYTPENLGHFGLAAEYYCHFTSPIRRYPDLQIHRIIKAMLDGKLGSLPKLANWCKEVSEVSSEREKASEQSERDIKDYYKAEYMMRHVGEQFAGVVSGVTNFGIFVELDNTCEGIARLDNLPEDKYEFIENKYLLKGDRCSFTLGQDVTIEVVACDIENRRVTFKVLEG